jgi:glycerophosphoryl diester phosphodiesterase
VARAPSPAIHALTLAELKRYDIGRANPASRYAAQFPQQQAVDGERFPTLDELFALVKATGKSVRLNLETKIRPAHPGETVDAATFARLTVAAVRAAVSLRAPRSVVRLAHARRGGRRAGIATACLTSETKSLDTVRRDGGAVSPWHGGLDPAHGASLPRSPGRGCATWSPDFLASRSRAIRQTHALGLAIVPWTVNDRRRHRAPDRAGRGRPHYRLSGPPAVAARRARRAAA